MLWWLAQNAVLAGVLATFVVVACRIGRFRPAVRHALWLVVLLKLVTPPVLTWPGVTLAFQTEPEALAAPESESEPALTYQVLVPAPDDLIVTLTAPEASTDFALQEPDGPPPAVAAPAPAAAVAW